MLTGSKAYGLYRLRRNPLHEGHGFNGAAWAPLGTTKNFPGRSPELQRF